MYPSRRPLVRNTLVLYKSSFVYCVRSYVNSPNAQIMNALILRLLSFSDVEVVDTYDRNNICVDYSNVKHDETFYLDNSLQMCITGIKDVPREVFEYNLAYVLYNIVGRNYQSYEIHTSYQTISRLKGDTRPFSGHIALARKLREALNFPEEVPEKVL